jgi:hypothetical protein
MFVKPVGGTVEPTSDDLKEVYARFGLAYYLAEALHRGLCNLYTASRMPPSGQVARARGGTSQNSVRDNVRTTPA